MEKHIKNLAKIKNYIIKSMISDPFVVAKRVFFHVIIFNVEKSDVKNRTNTYNKILLTFVRFYIKMVSRGTKQEKFMKKRRKYGVWLLVFMLVFSQLSYSGNQIFANAQSSEKVTEEKEKSMSSDEKKEEAKKSDKTEEEKKDSKKPENSEDKKEEAEGTEKESEKPKDKDASDEKESETTKGKDETTKDDSQESSPKETTEATTQKKEETTNGKEDNAGENNGETSTSKEDQQKETRPAMKKAKTLDEEDAEEEEKTEKSRSYNVKIQPVDKETQGSISGASITMEKSTDPQIPGSWTSVRSSGSGQYQLSDKEEEKDCYYRFSIKANDYYPFASETFSFTQDTNPYFDLGSIKDGNITIQAEMKKKPEQYRVTIKAVDEQGKPIENAKVSMEWSVDIYGSYTQEAVSEGIYDLKIKRGNDLLYYKFHVAADGYTPYDGTKFCFDSRYWNPYFNADSVEQSFTITVSMTLKETALANAKADAVKELQNYKKLEDYRQEEQDQIKSIVEEWIKKIDKATTVNSVTWNLNSAKGKLDALKTNIEYENEEYRSRIYFQSSDGQKTYADQYGVVTITNIDSGNFYISHPDGTLYTNDGWDAKWRCVNEYHDLDHPDSIAFDVIVGTYGQLAGKFVGKYNATVALSDLGREIQFTVRVISGRVDSLRAYVDGKDVSGKTINVMGSEKKQAVIEGRLKGTNRWISIPSYSLKYTPGGSTSMNNVTAEFRTWGTSGSVTYTLDADRSVSVTIYIQASIVRPTSVKVECPEKATVGDWNGAFNQYVGIMEGQGGYRVIVTPDNASNPGVTWEDLTPDVATFQKLHALGIVPKKAGTAKFKVSCVDNPKISTTVKILFQYEKPLKTAKAEKEVYYARLSDKTINLNIITNGQKDSAKGASEQRFDWSYSTSGVVKVKDAVHYDKTSVTIPNWFSHTISILGEGVVYVTGTPYDTTEGCKPVKFKVVVSSDVDKDRAAAERVEKIILSIGKVTLEKKSLIQYARAEFQSLTSIQKGLVDDDIYAKLVAAELALRRLERGDSDGDGGNGGGDSQTSGNGAGAQTGGSLNSDSSGGDASGSAGGGNGVSSGASGTGNDSSSSGKDGKDAAAERNARARRRTNAQSVVQASTVNHKKTSSSSGKKAGVKGRKFFEVDIKDVPEEVMKMVNKISPETKIAVVLCMGIAFIYGFIRRRRQYLNGKEDL